MTRPQPTPRVAESPVPALLLGLVLGLSILKLGNPVILEDQIGVPGSLMEWIQRPWPTRVGLFLLPIVVLFHLFATPWRERLAAAPVPAWIWFGLGGWTFWQWLSHGASVDTRLSGLTLPHLLAVSACFILGVLTGRTRWQPLLIGVGIGATLCWLQAFNQHTFEFRYAREALVTGQQSGWTNLAPADVAELRQNGLIVTTNGVDIANPAILDKLARGRVHGSLVYPNALAGLVLLAFPPLATALWLSRHRLRPLVFALAAGLLGPLAFCSLLWSGSRSGWLIAVAMAALAVLLHPRLRKVRIPIAVAALVLGLGAFAFRNQAYFKKGATSVSARFDYWKAAAQNTLENPFRGSGPGTFMRPYAKRKAPDAEMARLVHNDYLQQFSDSGIPGGITYLLWVLGSLGLAWSRALRSPSALRLGILVGVTGWLIQGLSEFGLYIPPLAWSCFALLGIAVSLPPENPSTPDPAPAQTPPSPA